jgi:hypothetical protein
MTRDCLTSPPSFISRAPYTLPADAMAPLAALLARQPNAMVPALVAALEDRMGSVRAYRLIQQIMMESAK